MLQACVRNRIFIAEVETAFRFYDRLYGLLGRRVFGPQKALWINPCGSIHTFGMRFSIDVLFLTRGQCVRKILRGVRPNRVVFGGLHAVSVLELQSGWLAEFPRVGEKVEFRDGGRQGSELSRPCS